MVTKHGFSCLWWLFGCVTIQVAETVWATHRYSSRVPEEIIAQMCTKHCHHPSPKVMYAHVADLETSAIRTQKEIPLSAGGWMLICIRVRGERHVPSPWSAARASSNARFPPSPSALAPCSSVFCTFMRLPTVCYKSTVCHRAACDEKFDVVTSPPDRRYQECWAHINTRQQAVLCDIILLLF